MLWVGAVLSTVKLTLTLPVLVLPAASVTVEDIDQRPSDIVGKSQLFTVGDAT